VTTFAYCCAPFSRIAPPRLHDPSLDQALEAICLKAIAQTEGRYSSAAALAEDVERWMADEPVAAWHEPLARRARRWRGDIARRWLPRRWRCWPAWSGSRPSRLSRPGPTR
jgi:hypothetical protein